jgi:hypothetical protein
MQSNITSSRIPSPKATTVTPPVAAEEPNATVVATMVATRGT